MPYVSLPLSCWQYAACLGVVIVAQVIACGVLISHSSLAEESIERMFLYAKMGDFFNGYTVSSIQTHVSQ